MIIRISTSCFPGPRSRRALRLLGSFSEISGSLRLHLHLPSPHNSHIVLITHAPLCSLSFPFHFFYFYISLFCTCQTYFSQVLGSETISRRSQVEAVICFFSGTDKHRHYKPWTVNCLCLGALSSFW